MSLTARRVGMRQAIQATPIRPSAAIEIRSHQASMSSPTLIEHTTTMQVIAATFARRGIPSPAR